MKTKPINPNPPIEYKDRFIEILFPEKLHPEDIIIIEQPDEDHLGQAQLHRAIIGQQNPDCPNSWPLNSWTGERLGYIATPDLLEFPAFDCYWLEENGDKQNGQ